MDEGFHSDGHQGRGVVVVGPVDVGVGEDLREQVGLPQEKELAFGLRDGLAPKVAWECCGGAAQDDDEVIFPSLDGLFCDVAAVIIGGNKLICHVSERNLLLVCCGDLVVEDLVFWNNTLGFHAGKDGATGSDEVAGGAAAYGFNPNGV